MIKTHHYYSRTHRFPSLKYCLKKQLLITICEEAWGTRGVTNLYLCHLLFICNYQLGLMPVVLWRFEQVWICMHTSREVSGCEFHFLSVWPNLAPRYFPEELSLDRNWVSFTPKYMNERMKVSKLPVVRCKILEEANI